MSAANLPEYLEGKEPIEAHYEQEALQIGSNAQYLLEFLGAVGATNLIRMQVKHARKCRRVPALWK